jgi:Lectin C-type domain
MIDSAPVVSSCPASYQLVVGTPLTSRYRKLEVAKDVAIQTALCTADGAHLVVADNAAERAAIEEYGRNSKGFFWIGLSDSETEGVWKTSTGQVVASTDLPWGMKQPEAGAAADAEDCVLQAGGKYYDFKCTSAYVAVCECD